MQFPLWATISVTFFIQLIVLLIVASLIVIIKKQKRLRNLVRIIPVDSWPPLLLFFIYQISQHLQTGSLLPEVVIVWLCLGLFTLLWQIMIDSEMTYRRFFILFWRLSDLVLVIGWIVVTVIVFLKA